MSANVSVVIPVLDGARYLAEVLESVRAQGPEIEILVIDSGSGDGSQATAREAGARLLEIPREQFGHGRTRNLAAERSSGDLICFLTQDATPEPGWLDAFAEMFAGSERIGAAFGPHLPRPDTPVMIAREGVGVKAFANQLDRFILGRIEIGADRILAVLHGNDLLAQKLAKHDDAAVAFAEMFAIEIGRAHV